MNPVLEALDFRRWAARVVRQAGNQPDAKEAQRLISIAQYWVRLAEQRDSSEATQEIAAEAQGTATMENVSPAAFLHSAKGHRERGASVRRLASRHAIV
jgi:hypothetical protein